MGEAVDVAGAKNETSSKLEGIRAQLMLVVAGLARSLSGNGVLFP